MSEELHEECGVVAIYHLPGKDPSPLCPTQGPNEVSRLIPRMLLDLQNRGQLSCGMTSFNPNRSRLLMTHKDSGTVPEVFHQNDPPKYAPLMNFLAGSAAIGHVRYAAIEEADSSYAHPFERAHIKKNKWFSFAFNGQLANYRRLKERLLELDENSCFARDTDSEAFMHYFCAALKNSERDLLKVCQSLTKELDGAYTIVFLNALGEMFVARDPRGIKPLCYAFDGSLFACASESVALFNLGFDAKDIKDVKPGNMISVTPDGLKVQEFHPSSRSAFCFFEWVYFANAASVIDGTNVYLARKRLGEELARMEKESASIPYNDGNTIVVPVPDSSKAAADGMAYALGVPCVEGLMRNRYSGRTFIEGGETRQRKAQTKYTPIPEVLEGKRVFLVDDSIVRSTTMRILLQRIYSIGHAKEIHVRISCPPIMAPCFYGLDMSTYSELFATKFMMKHYGLDGVKCSDDLTTKWLMTPEIEAEMANDIGCDSLRFLHAQAIAKAISIPPFGLCRACFNHEYPTEWGCKLADEARAKFVATLTQAEK